MASLDVDSLFTSIPLDETIDVCINKPETLIHGMSKNDFHNLPNLATKEPFFTFSNTFYSQVDGITMGFSLGPIAANVFLSHHDEN